MNRPNLERLDYRATEDKLQSALHRQRYEFALEQIGPHAQSILEIGAGTGSFSSALASRCDCFAGIELDWNSCLSAVTRLGGHGSIARADAKQLPFLAESFSVVACLEVLEHLGDFRAGIREMHRCLKPHGLLILSVPYRRSGAASETNPYHLYEPGEGELTKCLRECFENVSARYQFFCESAGLTLARCLRLRRVLGLVEPYRQLVAGEPSGLQRLHISAKARGLRLHLLMLARKPKNASTAS